MANKKANTAEQQVLFSGSSVELVEKKGHDIKQNKFFKVPFDRLQVLDNFNDREDYGSAEEMDELAESIYQTGVQVPIKGYKEGEKYVVIVGHRRARAGEMILAKYGKVVVYPFQVYPQGSTIQDMLLDTLLTNSGKELTPLEKASTVGKLIKEKVPYKEIARALGGVSEVYVKNLHILSNAPEKAKKLIREGVVSATLIMAELKNKKGDIEKFLAEIENLAKGKEKKEGSKKAAVTKRETKESRAASSLGEFKRYRKEGNDIYENKAKQEAFEFICSMIDNQVSYEQIETFFTGK
jgi:ParB/RepB/Spo0J family partition protein